MPLHPAENRGYRELYVTGRYAAKRLGRLALSLDGTDAREPVEKAAESLSSRPQWNGNGVVSWQIIWD